jgi:methylamine dehydrogenase accessory protein MauD
MSALAWSNILLWLLVMTLASVVLALMRQIGVLHERIAPVGALMLAKGLKVGERAPELDVMDLDGQRVHVGGQRDDTRSLLLMFVSPTCPVCRSLLPILKSSRREEGQRLEIVLASDGDPDEQRAYVREQGLETFRYLLSAPLGLAYQVSRLPFAVLIDEAGVLRARGLINSREHLESLFEAQRLGVASLQEYLER